MEFLIFSSLLLILPVYGTNNQNDFIARTNSSNLCSRIPVQSCLHQLKLENFNQVSTEGKNSTTCQVEVANNTNSHLCTNQLWDRGNLCRSYDGCGVHVEAYSHMPPQFLPLYRTALNLSLSNISSHQTKLRYSDLSMDNFTFCINFTTHLNEANPVESLWYDCVFHSRLHESHSFQLEFLIEHHYGIFLFQIPREKDIRKGHGFLYVHLHYAPQLVITFQKTFLTKANNSHMITVCKWLNNKCHTVLEQSIDLKNPSTFSHRFRSLVTVSLGNVLSSGNFSVRIEDTNCRDKICYQATSSFFIIPEIDRTYVILLTIVGVFIFVAFFALIGCRKKLKNLFTGFDKLGLHRPTVLLVHDPATSDYCWVEAVQIFLQRWGAFDVWLDFIEIPLSPHKDPLIWYSEAMDSADVVAFIAPSADTSTLSEHRPTIYHHTFQLALELLATRISHRLKQQERGFMKRFVVLETNKSVIPDVCSSFIRFHVPEQLPKLIRYITNNSGTSNDGGISKKKRNLIACLLERGDKDNKSTVMESFRLIYEHLRQRNKSTKNIQIRDALVQDGKNETEYSCLLENGKANEDRDQRRQQLDREFGPDIVSVTALPTLG